ncbi:MAG: metallophosphoesterase family protein [Thermoproteales archaeon]|nr:metallophosphoesterase family protein [Thermoproteales archaeon]
MALLRAVAISDIHGRRDAVKAFLKDLKDRKIEVDYALVAGDIGCPEDPYRLMNILKMIRNFGLEVYYVIGNWDIDSRTEEANGIYNLDKQGPVNIQGFTLVGHGERFEEYNLPPNSLPIMLSHYPPYGILDRGFKYTPYRKGSHTGVIKLNYLLEDYNPLIHVFGHAHKSGGLNMKLGGTYYINVARLDRFTRENKCIGNYTLIVADRGSPPRIKHIYIGGVYKVCARCGKKVLMPPSWDVCKECMMKDELIVYPQVSATHIQNVSVSFVSCQEERDGDPNPFISKITVPLTTIRNKGVLREFIEDNIREEVYNILLKKHSQLLTLPKDSLLYLYPCPRAEKSITPFILRLLKCKNCSHYDPSKESCLIFRTLLKYKIELLWGIGFKSGGQNDEHTLEKYLLIFTGDHKPMDESLLEELRLHHFNVIVVSMPSSLLRRSEKD